MRFKVSREGGMSDSEVLAKIVSSAAPGELLEYSVLSAALSHGTQKSYSTDDVQNVVSRSERKVVSETCRALVNVRGRGYRVALASEHRNIAEKRKDRAGEQLRRGLFVLQHVDWDSMDENARRAHEGQLMVVSALHNAMSGMDARLKKIEDAIRNRNG